MTFLHLIGQHSLRKSAEITIEIIECDHSGGEELILLILHINQYTVSKWGDSLRTPYLPSVMTVG